MDGAAPDHLGETLDDPLLGVVVVGGGAVDTRFSQGIRLEKWRSCLSSSFENTVPGRSLVRSLKQFGPFS